MSRAPDETYLGDGVYASFDGYQIWLRIDNGSKIALDASVFAALIRFQEGIQAASEREGLRG